jgi:hypothetical protein
MQPFFNGSAMIPANRRQLEGLYQAARDPAERAQVLAAADPALRGDVKSLLARDSSKRDSSKNETWDQPARLMWPGSPARILE